jgi:hypothetical protein
LVGLLVVGEPVLEQELLALGELEGVAPVVE